MVVLNKIKPPTVNVFNPDGTFLGLVNQYEFNDILIQIKENKLKGYYIVTSKGLIENIDENGRVRCDDLNLFNEQLERILGF